MTGAELRSVQMASVKGIKGYEGAVRMHLKMCLRIVQKPPCITVMNAGADAEG